MFLGYLDKEYIDVIVEEFGLFVIFVINVGRFFFM